MSAMCIRHWWHVQRILRPFGLSLLGLLQAYPLYAEAEPIRVGVVTSASGPFAAVGIEIANTARLFGEERVGKVQIFICDDQGTSPQALQCLDKLTQQDKVTVLLGPFLQSLAAAAVPRAAKQNVPFVSLAPARISVDQKARNVFRIGTTRGLLVSRAAEFIRRTYGEGTLLVFEEPGLFAPGRTWSNVFPKLKVESKPAEKLDLSSATSTAQAVRPNIILVPGQAFRAPELASLTEFSPVVAYSFFGVGAYESQRSQRVYLVAAPGPQTAAGEAFLNQFRKRFGTAPSLGYGYQTYAALEILLAAVAPGATNEQISERIRKQRFTTILGTIAFQSDGDSTWQSQVVWRLDQPLSPVAAGSTPVNCSLADNCPTDCCKKCCSSCSGECAASQSTALTIIGPTILSSRFEADAPATECTR